MSTSERRYAQQHLSQPVNKNFEISSLKKCLPVNQGQLFKFVCFNAKTRQNFWLKDRRVLWNCDSGYYAMMLQT